MSVVETAVILCALAANIAYNLYVSRAACKDRREAETMLREARKTNADFAEAALLVRYGAVDESIEMLAPYAQKRMTDTTNQREKTGKARE